MAPVFQSVVLDTTLRELYSMDGTSEQEVILVHGMPDGKIQLAQSIPQSKRFVYQSPSSKVEHRDLLARLMLQVVPQVFGSIAGKMPLMMFNIEEGGNVQTQASTSTIPTYQSDASRTFAYFAQSQTPDPRFVAGPQEINLGPGAKIAVSHPMDCLLRLPHTVDPEVHYGLLSKTNLALSNLPTPASEVVNTNLAPSQLQDEHSLATEVDRMLESLSGRSLPFVIKLPLAVLGQGVFVIRTESDREEAITVLKSELKFMLGQLNESNEHMRPSSLVIQEMIPGESVSISLFITRAGRAIFTSCCKQITDSSGNWGGAYISYKEQERLQSQYAGTIEILAKFVHEKGYFGPMGADVMTNQAGKQLIIDLNMRVTGSQPLGFLKTHFSSERGLHEAVILFPLMLGCTREAFERGFESEFRDGSLVVNGWCHDQSCQFSIASIALAAPDSEKLNDFVKRMNSYRVNL